MTNREQFLAAKMVEMINKEKRYKASSEADELQPQYVFNLTHTELLLAIADGRIDAQKLAQQELANRGIGKEGTWVGFKTAATVWE